MINAEYVNKVENIYTKDGETTLKISQAPKFDYEQYDLDDPKDFKHYVDDVERIVRNSFEYRSMINYLKNTDGMDECSVLENVTSRDNSGVKIEIHHSPMTLYDICMAVIKKRRANKESMDVNAVAYEVIYNHYAKWVGLIPLSTTVHELTHNAYFFVPVDKVFGDYKPFKEAYYNYIDPAVLDSIDAAEEETANYDGSQMEIFNNHKIYIDKDDNNREKFFGLKPFIKNRIEDIKSGNNNTHEALKMPKAMCYIVDNTKPRTYK
jgi:hypothetical protein